MPTTLAITDLEDASITLLNVFVDAYNTTAELAQDRMTPIGREFRIAGTALVDAGNAYSTFFNALLKAGNRCKQVVCTVDGTILADLTAAEDDRGGPYCAFTTTEVVGVNTILCRFEITGRLNSASANQTLLSHRWTQNMALDGAGYLTRTVSGTINIARSTTGVATSLATNASYIGKAPYADLFREAIIPDLPGTGWRRESQDFALDETSTVLVYNFIDKRNTHDLPDGVRIGDMEFSYERSLEKVGLATVNFSCDLTGDANLAEITGTTGNRRLVEAAVALAKTRIDLNFKQTIIQRMRVTERNILQGFNIRFELDATVQSKSSDSATDITPLAYMIGQKFTVTRTVSRTLPPYGGFINDGTSVCTYGMIPHFLNNELSGTDYEPPATVPTATLFRITGVNSYGTVNVAVVSGNDGVAAMNSLFDGRFQTTQLQPSNEDNYTTMVTFSRADTAIRQDPGMVRLSPMYVGASDLVFQTQKPRVIVREHIEIARLNQAPPKVQREAPDEATLYKEDWRVAAGTFDAQGNRLFTGIYEREYSLYDAGTSINGFSTQTVGGVNFRRWGAPNGTVVAAYVPTMTDTGQGGDNNVLDQASGTFASAVSYGVPNESIAT